VRHSGLLPCATKRCFCAFHIAVLSQAMSSGRAVTALRKNKSGLCQMFWRGLVYISEKASQKQVLFSCRIM
jgi:hypothetical protein